MLFRDGGGSDATMTKWVSIGIAITAASWSGPSVSCEPVWVRPVPPDGYSSVFLGRVDTADWFRGEIAVLPERVIYGKAIKAHIRYDNIPFTCGWQSFHVGERVYVFGNAWAAPPDQVIFAAPESETSASTGRRK